MYSMRSNAHFSYHESFMLNFFLVWYTYPQLCFLTPEMLFDFLQIIPGKLPLGKAMGVWERGREETRWGLSASQTACPWPSLLLTPLLSPSLEMPVTSSLAFPRFWVESSVFSIAALDFNFLRFPKSVPTHLLSGFQTFKIISFPEKKKCLKITSEQKK